MIWTEAQVEAVRRLVSWLDVDADLALHRKGVMEHAASKAVAALREAALSHAVDIDDRDVRVTFEDQEARPGVNMARTRVTAHWWPSTTEVEISGGHEDGTIATVEDVRRPLMVAEPVGNPFARFTGETHPAPAFLASRVLRYELRRWNDADRRWVFELTSRG